MWRKVSEGSQWIPEIAEHTRVGGHGAPLTNVIGAPCEGERGECRGRDPPGTLKWQI